MKLVSSLSDEDLHKLRTLEEVEHRARVLTSNLLRVVRGAGKPHDVVRDAALLVQASNDFQEVHGYWPYDPIAKAIRYSSDDYRDGMSDAAFHIEFGQSMVVRGALQLAASEMLGQRPQSAAGRSEIFNGVDSIEFGRGLHLKERRPAFTARSKAAAAGPKKRARPGKRKA